MQKFEQFKQQFNTILQNGDTEIAHSESDDLLCEIALCASRGELTELQTGELIELYNEVPKWFA